MTASRIFLLSLCASIAAMTVATTQAQYTWNGSASALWSNNSNWSSAPGYGSLYFSGTSNTTNTDDSITSENALFWSGTSNWTLNQGGSTVLSLYDNGGVQSKIENDGSGLVTINLPINFAMTVTTNPWAEINAVGGSITFGSAATLNVNGSGVNGVKFWGTNGNAVTFNNTVNSSGKWFATTGSDAVINVNGAVSTSGTDFYVMNAGVLNIGAGGSLTVNAIRLGGDYSVTGNQNQAEGGTFALVSSTGGQTFASIIDSVSGNTSNALYLKSLNTSGTNTVSGPVFLDSPLNVQNSSGGTFLFSGTNFDIKQQPLTVSGSGTTVISAPLTTDFMAGGYLLKSGPGTLILQGTNNDYTGTSTSSLSGSATQISGGVLGIYADLSLGAVPASAYANIQFTGTGGALQDTSSNISLATNRSISIASTATGTLDSDGNTFTVPGLISGSGALAIASSIAGGNVVLSNASNSYSGGTTVLSGTLSVSANGDLGASAGGVTLNGGTVAFTAAEVATPNTHPFTIGASGGTISVDGAGSAGTGQVYFHTANTLQGSGALTLTGTGLLSTTGAGNLRVDATNSYSGNMTIQSGGLFEYGVAGAVASAATFTLGNNGGLNVDSTLTLPNAVTVNGTNSVLYFSNGGTAGVFSGNITLNQTLGVNLNDWYDATTRAGTISGLISGTGGLTVNSANSLTISDQANTYSGPTTLNTGVILIDNCGGNSGATGSITPFGSGTMTLNSGSLLHLGNNVGTNNFATFKIANPVVVNGATIYEEDGFQHLTGAVNVTGSSTLGSTFSGATDALVSGFAKGLFIDGLVSGTGSLTLQQSGIDAGHGYDASTVYFTNTGTSSYSGTITVIPYSAENGSYLFLVGNNALANATINLTGNNGSDRFGTSTFIFGSGTNGAPSSSAYTIGGLSGSGNFPLANTLVTQANDASGGGTAVALTVGGNNGSTTYSGVMSGAGSLTKAGTGTLTISGANTYTGATTISTGTLSLTGTLGSGGGTAISNGATFTEGSGAGIFGTSSLANTAGTTTLGGSNSYSGATNLTGGTLILAANSGNTVSGTSYAIGASSALTLSGSTTLDLLSNGTTTIFKPSSVTEASGNGPFNFFVGNNGSGTGNTVILANIGQFGVGSTSPTFNVSGTNGYTLQLGSGSAGTGALNFYNTTIINSNTPGVTLSIPGGLAVNYNSAYTMTFGGAGNFAIGPMSQDGSALTFTDNSTGTVALNGSNSYSGATTVGGGVLTINGPSSGGGAITVGNTASTNATLNIASSGTVTATTLSIGTNATAPSAVNQSSGTLNLTTAAGLTDLPIGDVASGYGYYKLSGGTLAANEIDIGGAFNASTGVMDITGGTFNDTGWITIARGGTTSSGVLNVTGGTINLSAATGNIGMFWAGSSGAQAIMNIGGGAGAANVIQSTTTGYALQLADANITGGLSEVNLRTNGLLQIGAVADGDASTSAFLDFNGGTLKANLANASYLTSADMKVYVYGNGGTFDNDGVAITIGNGFLAPTGSGANSNPSITAGGSGYIGAPMVTATGAGGTGATAYAVVTSGSISQIVITNPGTGYTGPIGFTLTGGGGSGATIGTVTQTADTSGGMTFQGAGTTTISGASTYTGATNISAGTLSLTGTLGGGSGGTAISNGATFTESSTGVIAGTSSLTNTAGTTTIGGSNNYTGATSVNAGTLNINGGYLANTSSVSVAGGATLTANGNTGNTIAGLVTVSGSSSAAGQGNINLSAAQGSALNTVLNLPGGLTIGGASAGQVSELSFYLSGTSSASDLINLGSGVLTGNAGGAQINIGTASLNNATYTLIDYGTTSGLTVGTNLTVGTHPSVLFTNYTLSLVSLTGSTGALELTVAGTPTPNLAYWSAQWSINGLSGATYNWGDNNGISSTNWSSDPAGLNDTGQLPGTNTDVVFAASNATGASLNTTLGQNFTINSLTVDGSATDPTSSNAVVIGGTGSLTIEALASGTGSLGYSAGTGIMVSGSAQGLTINASGGVVVANSQAWTNQSAHTLAVSSNVTGLAVTSSTSTLTLNGTGAGATNLSGSVGNGGAGGSLALAINQTGGSTVTLSGSNSYSGGTTVSNGALNIQNNNALGTGAVSVAGGAALQLQGGITTGSNALTLNGAGLTASPAGALDNVGGTNTYAGLVTLGSSATIESDSGSLALSNAGTITGSGFTLTLAGAANGSIASIIGTGAGGVIMNGTGLWALSGVSTYTGATAINSGTLSISANTNLGSATVGQAPVTLNGGTLATTNSSGALTDTHAITVGSSGGTISVDSSGSAGNGQLVMATANTLLGSGPLTLTGTGNLTSTGAGNIRITATNSYSGNITVQNGGIFEVGVAGAVTSSGTFIIGNQGELGVDSGLSLPNAITVAGGNSSVLSFVNGTANFAGPITLNANATIGLRDWYNPSASTSGTITGVISDNNAGFGITTNPGTSTGGVLTLTNANTYIGATNIAAGTTVQLGNGGTTGSISTSSAITDNGTLKINRSNAVTQGTDFSSAGITGTGGFTQAGAGTTTLTASNSYTGATSLASGTLVLQASSGNTSGGGVSSALSNSSSSLTLGASTTLEVLGDTNGTVFEPGAAGANSTTAGILETFSNGPFNFYVGNVTSSGSAETLVLGNFGQFGYGNTSPTFNFSGTNGYTLQIGSGSAGTGALDVFNNTTFNSNTAGVTVSIPGGITINYPGTYTLTFGGAGNFNVGPFVQDASHLDNIVYGGTGTLSLSGASTISTLTVNSGAVVITSGTTLDNNTANNDILIADAAGTAAILSVSSGAAFTGTAGGNYMQIGAAANSIGILNNAGTVSIANNGAGLGLGGSSSGVIYNTGVFNQNGTNGLFMGNGVGSYGYIYNTGTFSDSGALGLSRNDAASPASASVIDVAGGAVNVAYATSLTLNSDTSNANTTQARSQINITGGTLTAGSTTAGQVVVNAATGSAGGYASINVAGGNFSIPGTGGINLNAVSNANNVSTLSLQSGTMSASYISNSGSASSTGVLSLNGGTLAATAANGTGLIQTGVTTLVEAGGGTINNGGFSVTIPAALQAPSTTGSGVTSITLAGTDTGYVGTPVVVITGGGGTGAAAIANFNPATGTITGFTITSPGSGYTSAPTISLYGGDGVAGAGAGIGTATATAGIGSVGSGGMTFAGAGTTALSGSSTFSGSTTVSGGVLSLTGAGSINGSSGIAINGAELLANSSVAVSPNVTVASGGMLAGTGVLSGTVEVTDNAGNVIVSGNASSPLTIGTLTFDGAATLNLTSAGATTTADLLTTNLASGAVNTSGIVTINAADSAWTNGVYDLVGFSGSIGGQGFADFAQGTVSGLNDRQNATLGISGNDIILTIAGDNPVWTGSYSSDWTTDTIPQPGNWKLETAQTETDYQAGDTVVFDDTASTGLVNILDANVTPFTTTFNNNVLNYVISSTNGFGIAGTGSVMVNGTGSVTISTNNSYSGGTTVNAGTLTLSGNNNFGTGGVTVAGGTLVLTGSNTYTGGTVLNSGLLDIGNTYALGSGTITFAGGTFDNTTGSAFTLPGNNAQIWDGSFTFAGSSNLNLGTGAVTLGASSAVTVTAGTLTVGGAIGGSGYGITLNGPGALNLAGASTYSGPTFINSGTLNLTGTLGSGAGTAITSAGTFNEASTGVISGTSSVTVTGGTTTLAGANTYTAGNSITGGLVSIAADNNLGASSSAVSLNGGTLTTTAGMTDTHVVTIGSNGGTIDVASTNTSSYQYYFHTANTLQGSGTLTLMGTGVLTPSLGNLRVDATNSYSGNMILQSGGIFEYGAAGAVASGATFTINNNGELAVQGNSAVSLPNAITVAGGSNSVLSFENGNGGNFSGPITLDANAIIGLRDWYAYGNEISGAISGVISGSGFGITTNPGTTTGGVLTLTASNTYTGPTNIAAGTTLQIGNGGSIASSSLVSNSGALIINNSAAQGTTFNNSITGSGSFTQSGSGAVTLSGSDSFTGLVAFSGSSLGTIVLANPNALAGTTDVNFGATTGNKIDYATNGGDSAVPMEASTGFAATIVSDLASPGTGINHTVGTVNLGGGTLTLTAGANVNAGAASLTFPTVNLNASISTATTFVPNGVNVILGTVASTVNNAAHTLDLDGNTAGNIVSGAITNGATGTIAVTKSNTSTWNLEGADTYTGATTVSGGTLIVSGSLSGTASVSVTSGATLEVDGLVRSGATIGDAGGTVQGTGSVGPVNVNDDGNLAPGLTVGSTAAGALTANGNVSFIDTASTFSLRVGVTTGSSGDSDQLIVPTGTVTLNDTPLQLTLGSVMFNNSTNTALIGSVYTLINGGAAATGSGSNLFYYNGSALADETQFTQGGLTFEVVYGTDSGIGSVGLNGYIDGMGSGNNVDLVLEGVPEPGTWAMMLGGLGMLISIQRIRRRSH